MTRSILSRSILHAATSAVLLTSTLALAQQRVANDGRALDANPRIDSGGYNSGGIPAGMVVTGNQIVTGNVTGGREFRGTVPYTDSREFRGNVAGQDFDRFIAGSSGAPTAYSAQTLPGQVMPFYGRRLAEAPPTGFVQNGFTGTFVFTPNPNPSALDNRLNTQVEPPKPSDLLLPGPIDPQTNLPTMLSASPLLGVRQWKASEPEDRAFVRNYSSMREESALDRLRLDPMLIKQMREELSTNVDEVPGGEKKIEPRPGQISNEVQKPFDAPQNEPLNNRLNSNLNDKPLPGDVRPEGAMYRRMLLPPSQQSQQYAELERRLRRYYEDRLKTDEDKNREFLKDLRAREAQDKATSAGPALSGALRNQGVAAVPDYARIGQELATQRPTATQNPADVLKTQIPNRPAPQKITSLATGVQVPGLAKLLKTAEDLMHEGKFMAALEQYEAGAQLARNNSMVLLGQANAELAVGFYRKAEQHLRIALRGDPVLLMAQFDLRGMLGDAKLNAIVGDLKTVAVKQERDSGAPLLLAYIAYNTGNEQGASLYLDLAQKRSEGRDDLPQLLRQHWNLPPSQLPPSTRPAK